MVTMEDIFGDVSEEVEEGLPEEHPVTPIAAGPSFIPDISLT